MPLVTGCRIPTLLPGWLVEEWLREDIPYSDLTTAVLGVADKQARAQVVARERIVVCGVSEAEAVYEAAGARVEVVVEEGGWAEPGAVILRAWGSAGSLHAAWRTAQTLIAIGSAVATYTRLMVERARKANPDIIVAVARKAPPGLRHLYYRCVLCGGATLHRVGISDTILVFPNHTRLLGGVEVLVERLRQARGIIGERRVVVEVESLEEARRLAESGVVDEIQLDHMSPNELAKAVREIKTVNPSVKVAVGGGITLENVEEYAKTGVDVIVTSAPYWAKPADITTRIEPSL